MRRRSRTRGPTDVRLAIVGLASAVVLVAAACGSPETDGTSQSTAAAQSSTTAAVAAALDESPPIKAPSENSQLDDSWPARILRSDEQEVAGYLGNPESGNETGESPYLFMSYPSQGIELVLKTHPSNSVFSVETIYLSSGGIDEWGDQVVQYTGELLGAERLSWTFGDFVNEYGSPSESEPAQGSHSLDWHAWDVSGYRIGGEFFSDGSVLRISYSLTNPADTGAADAGEASPDGQEEVGSELLRDVSDQYDWTTATEALKALGYADYVFRPDASTEVFAFVDEGIGVWAMVGGDWRIIRITSPPPLPPRGPTEYDCTVQDDIPESECEALIDIYLGNNGPEWRYWLEGSPWLRESSGPCSWVGVWCWAKGSAVHTVRQLHMVGVRGLSSDLPEFDDLLAEFPHLEDGS